jgi:hypothetical protein
MGEKEKREGGKEKNKIFLYPLFLSTQVSSSYSQEMLDHFFILQEVFGPALELDLSPL